MSADAFPMNGQCQSHSAPRTVAFLYDSLALPPVRYLAPAFHKAWPIMGHAYVARTGQVSVVWYQQVIAIFMASFCPPVIWRHPERADADICLKFKFGETPKIIQRLFHLEQGNATPLQYAKEMVNRSRQHRAGLPEALGCSGISSPEYHSFNHNGLKSCRVSIY